MPERPVLLYDSGCRFCRFAARAAWRLDRRQRIAFLPLQDSQADAFLADVPAGERLSSMRLVDPDGRVFSRGSALTRLIDHLGAPMAARVAGRMYEPIARRRSLLGKSVPDGHAPRRYP